MNLAPEFPKLKTNFLNQNTTSLKSLRFMQKLMNLLIHL